MPEDQLAVVPPDAVVAVGMSGGVDSSVAAARVLASGRRAVGITLAMWPGDTEAVRDRGCCSIDAVEDARRVARDLGIRHYTWNLEAEFEERVVAPFVEAHAAGLTTNPCTRCNERIKFGLLLERARSIGATHLATGHYARRGSRRGRHTLHRSVDSRRDQSYVLHRLDQEQLGAAVFPLGCLESKAAVRAEAAQLGLATAAKPESQDLCFATTSVRDLLAARLGDRMQPGRMLDAAGSTLGMHGGVALFTVGQRAGSSVRPTRPDQPPLYVIEVRPADNAVVVGERELLLRRTLAAGGCRWVGGRPPAENVVCTAQLRAHGIAHEATVDVASTEELHLSFADAVPHVSPGQAVVLYRGDEVLGGGVIRSAA